jgi:osmotically-inducible protein OsmY
MALFALTVTASACVLAACEKEPGAGSTATPAANEYSVSTPPAETGPDAAKAAAPAAAGAVTQDENAVLAGKVQDAVKQAIGDGAYKVDVTAKDGTVTLWGTTDTDEERLKAEQAARAAAGDAAVTSKLTVVKGS